jgi:hypothetical protein
MKLREVATGEPASAVQAFAVGTVVQVFLLSGRFPAESWDSTTP